MMTVSRTSLTSILLALLICAAGCREVPGVSPAFGPGPSSRLAGTTGSDDPVLHDALESMWHNDEGVLMQVFRQTIDCTVGGTFTVQSAGWPAGHAVSLTVDPGTVPLNRPNPVEFVMEIPVTGPVTATSVPFEFHPDGIRFSQPVHIEIVWPDWAGTAPASGMDLWYLEQEEFDGSYHYRILARKPNQLDTAKADIPRGRYSIEHFSRWNMGSGGGEDPTGSPSGTPLDALTRAAEGDCCWAELAYDQDVRVHAGD